MLSPGDKFKQAGQRYLVLASQLDGARKIYIITPDGKPELDPEPAPRGFAPAVADALIQDALDPLSAARWLGVIDGYKLAADLCQSRPDYSGNALAPLLRDVAAVKATQKP